MYVDGYQPIVAAAAREMDTVMTETSLQRFCKKVLLTEHSGDTWQGTVMYIERMCVAVLRRKEKKTTST